MYKMNNDAYESGFSGLEAAMVMIAFVVVGAVFAYVMLGVGFFSTQKMQEVTYSGVKGVSSNLVTDGLVRGTVYTGCPGETPLDLLYLKITNPQGAEAQRLSDLLVVFSSDANRDPITLSYTAGGGSPTAREFRVYNDKNLIQPGDGATLIISPYASDTPCSERVGPGQSFTLEIKPKMGASVLLKRTLPDGYAGGYLLE